MRVVLDQRALDALATRHDPGTRKVRQAMEAARRLHREVITPTVVLAELYRGGGRNQFLDAMLSREQQSIRLRDTDRSLARIVGGVLSAAHAGSEDLADAHVVAVAVEAGGGVILTGDPHDMRRLADAYRTVAVEQLPSN